MAVKGTVGGETHVHTLHFRAADALANEQGLIDQWQTSCRTAYRNIFVVGDTPVDTITVQQVCGSTPLRAPVIETEIAPNRAGGEGNDTSNLMPTFVAGVVSVRTAFAGKSRRGRFYIGGLTEAGVTQNILGSVAGRIQTYLTALETAFRSPNALSGWSLVVHSRKLAAVPGTQCQDSSTLVTSLLLRNEVGTMRSRKLGHGT
jgi:hypothetical protein